MLKSRSLALFCALIAVAVVLPARGEVDPPGRVARVSYLQGDISFQPAGAEDWATLGMNRPLTTSDRVWTAENSRAEMHVGNAALRLGPNSGFAFLNLNDNTTQVQLTQGVLSVRLRELGAREAFEVDTPNVALTLLRAGLYRIDVDADGNVTSVTVRSGYAGASGGGRSFTIHAKEQAYFTGSAPEYSLRAESGFDAFDDWCATRDTREDRAVSARYVSRGVIGYEDLDDYGAWQQVPTYGYLWVPRAVPVGWAPYRFGHWAWIGPWGWTWIDDAPWGFAPFHYGRWVWAPAGYWGWVPGPMVVRPYYAPALVAWVGGMQLSFGGPAYGWFPLGYREVYSPWYRASRNYWHQVNVTNVYVTNTYINNIYEHRHDRDWRHTYMNQHVNGAVTAVPEKTLLEGRPVRHEHVDVPLKDWKSAQVMHAPPASPTRDSFVGAAAGAPAVRPPVSAVERQVVTRIKPAERPAPFSKAKMGPGDTEGRAMNPPAERTVNGAASRETRREQRDARAVHAEGAEPKAVRTEDTGSREHGNVVSERPGNVLPGMGRNTRETFGSPSERQATKSGNPAVPGHAPEMREPNVGSAPADSRMRRPASGSGERRVSDLGERRAIEKTRVPSPPVIRHEEAARPPQQRAPEITRPPRSEAVREMPRVQAPRETPRAQAPREAPRRSVESKPEPRPQAAPHEQRAPRQQFR